MVSAILPPVRHTVEGTPRTMVRRCGAAEPDTKIALGSTHTPMDGRVKKAGLGGVRFPPGTVEMQDNYTRQVDYPDEKTGLNYPREPH